jgi:hypothetical protein
MLSNLKKAIKDIRIWLATLIIGKRIGLIANIEFHNTTLTFKDCGKSINFQNVYFKFDEKGAKPAVEFSSKTIEDIEK